MDSQKFASQLTSNKALQNNINLAAGAFALVGLLVAGWYGYSWYNRSKEQAAYKDLAESLDAYSKVRQSMGHGEEKWTDIERGFKEGAQRNSSSKLQPYFLVFQADALIEQGKHQEALPLMDKAVSLLSKSNPLYYQYAIKRALMKTDAADEATQKQGRQELADLAKDATNPLQDMARYYAGLDALNQGDRSAAETILKEIQPGAKESAMRDSNVWHNLAQEALREA